MNSANRQNGFREPMLHFQLSMQGSFRRVAVSDHRPTPTRTQPDNHGNTRAWPCPRTEPIQQEVQTDTAHNESTPTATGKACHYPPWRLIRAL